MLDVLTEAGEVLFGILEAVSFNCWRRDSFFATYKGYFMFWLKVQVTYVYKHSLHGYNDLNIYKMQNLHPSLFEMSSIVISKTKMYIHVFHFLSSLPLSKHGLM